MMSAGPIWITAGNDASAPPPPVTDESRHRRRGYIGGVARLLIGAVLLNGILSCKQATAPRCGPVDTMQMHPDSSGYLVTVKVCR